MEIIIGLVLCGFVSIGVTLYLRYFATEGARHRPFERWCRGHPLLLAFRCQPGMAIDVYEIVRRAIEPHDYFANSQGRYPWQHYVVHVDGRRLANDVIAVFVVGCRQPRLREHRPDLPRAIDEVGHEAAGSIDEVWLHGQLHAVNRVTGVHRDQMAWIGTLGEDGTLDVHAMIGQPPWLKETLDAAA
jgi:hypothetical protein